MMNQEQIDHATLDELNDELAAGGMPSGETDIASARKSVRALIAEFATKTISKAEQNRISRAARPHTRREDLLGPETGRGIKMFERTSVGETYPDVILIAGMINAHNGRQIFGVFFDENDARSEDADIRAIATLDANILTPEQVAIAERNADRI